TVQEAVAVQETETVQEAVAAPETETLQEEVAAQEETTVQEEVLPEEEETAQEEEAVQEEETAQEEESEESDGHSWLWWLAMATIAAAALAATAYGGYRYGVSSAPSVAMHDTIVVRDTVFVADTASHHQPVAPQPETVVEKEDVKPEAKPEAKPETKPVAKPEPKQEAKPEDKSTQTVPILDQYEQKDDRVRLGAYRIIGLDHEVKVLAGQTFYSICRAHLGPDMECYVEVYNNMPRNPKVKEGQTIRIPKLQLKKRRK
ncbi:MAG: hypothetical protein IJ637_04715, partial [Prevotella sp.]|nr:hypothetical protein [Prevotella sp.]